MCLLTGLRRQGPVLTITMMQVCDQPHPLLIAQIVEQCLHSNIDEAYNGMRVRPHQPCQASCRLGAELVAWTC